MAGPRWTVPFIGGIIHMVQDPYEFWDQQKSWSQSRHGISWNSLVGKMILFLTDTDQIRHVLMKNDEDHFTTQLHPSAKDILGDTNIAFMTGPMHKRLRSSFLDLFTRKALTVYVQAQDRIVRTWLATLKDSSSPQEMRDVMRMANLETSQTVFAGPYLGSKEEREAFSQAYLDMTEGFLAIPVCLPGTGVWRARKGRKHVVKVLTKAAEEAMNNYKNDVAPVCLMDFWVRSVDTANKQAEANGEPPLEFSTYERMAEVMMDFLFASQDATSAALTWVLALMADHPDVYQKVREESLAVRGSDLSKPIDGEVIEQLVYTRNVIKELLRYRPVAPMLIEEAVSEQEIPGKCPFKAPKGAWVTCSLVAACENGFTEGSKFDPDRWGKERNEGSKHAKNWLPFGAGPHACPGREYAQNQLTTFLALMSTTYNLKRTHTSNSHKIKYLPTLYPHDCLMQFEPLVAH
jgi:cytochrome P450 family 710 subfamily A protein